MMFLFWLELKKMLSSGALWIFIILCLTFNFLIIFEEQSYPNPSQVSMRGAKDVFDGYDTTYIAEAYINVLKLTGSTAEAMRDKYAKLQISVDKKASTDESLSPYFGDSTYWRHRQLYGGLMNRLLIEGVLIAVLLTLLSLGYEHNQKTWNVVYAAKTGRKVLRYKLLASVTSGIGVYALLAVFTLGLYFTRNNYNGVWDSSVSSIFNYIYDKVAGIRPFSTWYSFTLSSYLWAVLAVSLGVILCFIFMAFIVGTLSDNNYIGFIILLTVNAGMVALPQKMPAEIRFPIILSPIWLWLKQLLWFTDGDFDILWPHFETVGVCTSLAILAICSMLAGIRFRRKDLL